MTSVQATRIALIILALVSIFHFLVIAGLIPYGTVWGGRLSSDREMYLFETVSLLVNAFLAFVLLVRAKLIREYLPPRMVRFILRLFLFLFVLNTVGNLLAKTVLEKSFSLITFCLAVLIWFVLKEKSAD